MLACQLVINTCVPLLRTTFEIVQSSLHSSALEENTDALLDLIARNDELLHTPTSTPGRTKGKTSKLSLETQPPPQPTSGSMSNGLAQAGLTTGPATSLCDSLEAAELHSDLRMHGNFTPAPLTASADLRLQAKGAGDRGRDKNIQFTGRETKTSGTQDSTEEVEGRRVTAAHGSQALENLLELLQGWVRQSVGWTRSILAATGYTSL